MKIQALFVASLLFTASACNLPNPSKEEVKQATSSTPKKAKKREGTIITYYKDTKIKKIETTYKNGIKEGPAKNFYKNGKLKILITYKNGIKHGVAQKYYESGQLYRETMYKEGEIIGERKFYHKNGELKAIEPYNQKGDLLFGTKEFNSKGKQLTKYPTIKINEIDNLVLGDEVILEFSLSMKRKNVTFYIPQTDDKITSNNIFDNNMVPLKPQAGIAKFRIPIPKGMSIMKKLEVAAEYTTYGGAKKLTKTSYNLALSNY
ncbi:toxin-antitoxin system YwqK family antitoxin [Sediminitomix flava]|uniref:MORN repeat protein n=1 Tax=Sediminitomix flava TaxID=379075 RepID=A0A315ZAH1_SEDFL|nr:hypothetical protein [Sediminitomix flava]PWJ41838.1 MORN repeat protein [Sediminitomix flava]